MPRITCGCEQLRLWQQEQQKTEENSTSLAKFFKEKKNFI